MRSFASATGVGLFETPPVATSALQSQRASVNSGQFSLDSGITSWDLSFMADTLAGPFHRTGVILNVRFSCRIKAERDIGFEFMQTPFNIPSTLRLILLALFIGQSASVPAQSTPVEQHGQLRVQGNRVVDKSGSFVALRGMSFFWSQWGGQYCNSNVVKWLRDDWHCTVVRVAMGVESGGYLTNPEREKEKVKTVVQAAIDLGIYVIIDWHDHNADKHLAQAQVFFEEMARLYGKYPNVIYELWNEPLKQHDWSTIIKPYHEAVIPKIRSLDLDNLIICGTQTWSQDVDKASRDPLKFDNIAYTLHFYAATHKESLRTKARTALANGVALMVTEWGTSESSGNGRLDEEETRNWWALMDENQLSWCNWSLIDKNETSAALIPKASATGGWSTNDISRSGLLVREELRAKNP